MVTLVLFCPQISKMRKKVSPACRDFSTNHKHKTPPKLDILVEKDPKYVTPNVLNLCSEPKTLVKRRYRAPIDINRPLLLPNQCTFDIAQKNDTPLVQPQAQVHLQPIRSSPRRLVEGGRYKNLNRFIKIQYGRGIVVSVK